MKDLVIVLGFLAFMTYMGLIVGAKAVTQRACLAAGYPAASVSFLFDRYCVKRLDQTDVVVPFHLRGEK